MDKLVVLSITVEVIWVGCDVIDGDFDDGLREADELVMVEVVGRVVTGVEDDWYDIIVDVFCNILPSGADTDLIDDVLGDDRRDGLADMGINVWVSVSFDVSDVVDFWNSFLIVPRLTFSVDVGLVAKFEDFPTV